MTPAQTIATALDAVRITSREYAALHPCTERRGRPYKRTSRIAPPTEDDARRVVDVCSRLAWWPRRMTRPRPFGPRLSGSHPASSAMRCTMSWLDASRPPRDNTGAG